MRVCDRHPEKRAVDSMQTAGSGMDVDLCSKCITEVENWLANQKQEEIEKPNLLKRVTGRSKK
jgi:hypothetical protein